MDRTWTGPKSSPGPVQVQSKPRSRSGPSPVQVQSNSIGLRASWTAATHRRPPRHHHYAPTAIGARSLEPSWRALFRRFPPFLQGCHLAKMEACHLAQTANFNKIHESSHLKPRLLAKRNECSPFCQRWAKKQPFTKIHPSDKGATLSEGWISVNYYRNTWELRSR